MALLSHTVIGFIQQGEADMVLERIQVQKETALNQIHVVEGDNTLSIGVDAFPAMWDRSRTIIKTIQKPLNFYYYTPHNLLSGFHTSTSFLQYGASL